MNPDQDPLLSAAPQQPAAPAPLPPSRGGISTVAFVALGILVIALIAGGVWAWPRHSAAPAEQKLVRIGFSLDTVKIQRWADERDIMTKRANDLGATVTTFSAENDDATQISQIENFIAQKMDVIIVVAHNSKLVGPVLTKAQTAGIKVIDYDRLTNDGSPDLYLSFDSVKVGNNAAQYVVDEALKKGGVPNIAYVGGSGADNNGHLVAQGAGEVLDPLVKAGKINLVYNEFTPDWNPSIAYDAIKKLLDQGVKIDGVAVANDGMASGVVQALSEKHLDGKVPVSGQDGELQAIQRIVAGTQLMTSWKPGRPLAERAIDAAIALANGKTPETNGTVNNGTADIKSYLLDPIVVTKDNIRDTIIKSGTFTEDEVYGTQH